MKIVGRYFVLKLKSCLKAFGKSATGMIGVLLLLIVSVLGISFVFQSQQVLEKIKVGMVIPESESMVQTGMKFISAMDSIESICEFTYMNEEDAREGLQNGDLQVVIILPVNFYQDVYKGYNTPAEILMAASEGVNHQVFKELMISGVSYLQTSEAGVYAMLDSARSNYTIMRTSEVGDYMAQKYMVQLFDRMDVYEEKTVSSFGIVDYTEYLVVMLLMFIMLLVGTNFSALYQQNEKYVEIKLRAEGIPYWLLSIIKILVITICLWILWTVSYSGLCIASSMFDLDILWWNYEVLLHGLGLSLSIAAFYHLVYQLTGNATQGSILLVFINIAMLLCSGIIIPSSYFNDGIAFWGRYTPVALWNEYVQRFVFDTITMEWIGIFAVVTFVEIIVGAVVVWKDV